MNPEIVTATVVMIAVRVVASIARTKIGPEVGLTLELNSLQVWDLELQLLQQLSGMPVGTTTRMMMIGVADPGPGDTQRPAYLQMTPGTQDTRTRL